MVHIRLDVHRNRLTNVDIWVTALNTALLIGASVSGEESLQERSFTTLSTNRFRNLGRFGM